MTVKEAYKKITESKDLKKKAVEAFKAGKADEFLKEQGIDLTLEDIKDYLTKNDRELTKQELDMAAGGCNEDGCDWTETVFSVFTIGIGCAYSAGYQKEDAKYIYDCEQ